MRLWWSSLLLFGLAAPALGQERALAPLEVRPTPAFQRAVAAGTRTATGVPGPDYWQQRVGYDLAVTVDPATRLLTGHETVRYTNASPDTLPLVFFHLYQNLFSETAMRARPVPNTGGLTLTALAVDGEALEVDPVDQRQTILQGTVLGVRLPQPLLPGASTTFTVDWHFTIPQGEGVPRMGMVDSTTGQIAQWYPQIAVYDDLVGWDMRPYLANGEFYLPYGTFDVAVTAPAGTVVQGTGTLQNPADVLPDAVRARLADAADGDDIVHVVTEADFGPGTATRGRAGETLTWRFHAENVRDAAFAFSDHYLWDATSGLVDAASGRRTAVHALFRPVATTWLESARMTKDAIETFSRNVYPYAYSQITSSEGLVGGMEYPMIVFVRNFDTARTTQEVIAHELGHEWFPMMVGSDETAYAWMDEGVNTYITIFANEHYDPASPERADVRQAYKAYTAQTNAGFDLMDAPDAIAIGGGSVGILGYRHPATALLALRAVLGDSTYDRALTTYVEKWLFKHPAPYDFFNTFEAVAGQDLDWFWAPWFFGPAISDQAVDFVETHQMGGTHVVITVRNDGTVLSPIRARVTTASGATALAEAPASIWFDGKRLVNVEVTVEGEVARVELDPEGNFADVDPSDDVWTP